MVVARTSGSHLKRFLLLVALAVPQFVAAQSNAITMLGGPSRCTLVSDGPLLRDVKPTLGHLFGVGYEHQGKGLLGISCALLNERRGAALDFVLRDENGNELGLEEVRYLFNHVALSLGVGFRTPGRLHAVASLAAVPAWLRRATIISPQLPGNLGDLVLTDVTDNVVRWGFSAAASAGFGWQFHPVFSASLQLRYAHSFIPLDNDDFFASERLLETSTSALLSIGYSWPRSKGSDQVPHKPE